MTTRHIIRAWKDEQYRLGLTEAERASLPAHPAGLIELPDAALEGAAGGAMTGPYCLTQVYVAPRTGTCPI